MEMDQRVLDYARHGDVEEIRELLSNIKLEEKNALVNYIQEDSLNTPLHMACANGHTDCVRELLIHGSRHVPNASGNFPLHWAVQNKHLEIVKLLLNGIPDIDVLAQNSFGRGCVTEAFQCGDTDILATLLEHSSASEERLAAGSGMDNASIREEDITDDTATDGTPRIVQETILEFQFHPSLKTLKARELALDWDKDAFGTSANEDITGVSIWSASLILSHWVVAHAEQFKNKTVCELGAGCGVSGLATYLYTNASKVFLTDLFHHTVENLKYNVALNQPSTETQTTNESVKAEKPSEGCAQCGVMQKFTPDNLDGKLMTCAGCRSVEYCSRICQKKAWKSHKAECIRIRKGIQEETTAESSAKSNRELQVTAIDWADTTTWPLISKESEDVISKYQTFDFLIGADLVYHAEIVPALTHVIDSLLSTEPGAKFIHVASQARDSLVEFKIAMEAKGFSCSIEIVPDTLKQNPLVGRDENASAELFDLHFNEMSDIYCLYTFTRA